MNGVGPSLVAAWGYNIADGKPEVQLNAPQQVCHAKQVNAAAEPVSGPDKYASLDIAVWSWY